MKPVVLILGLSGAGKDCASRVLQEECAYRHIDMDRDPKRAFQDAGFPWEWDKDISLVDFDALVAGIHRDFASSDRGAVLSFPTTYRFSHEQLNVASRYGIAAILLWGPIDRCWEVRCDRQRANKGTTPNRNDYFRKNLPTFETYESSDYDLFRVQNFEPNGLRPSRHVLLARILGCLANQGIEPTARNA